MKSLKIFIVLVVALALAGFAGPAQANRADLLHVSFLDGNVQVMTIDTGDWVPASVNLPLRAGDRLWVPAGASVEMMMRNGSTLRLDQESLLDIDVLDADRFAFYLGMGRLYANFHGNREESLQVDTPEASVRARSRTIFRVDIPDGSEFSDVAVLKGFVTVETKQEIRRVDEGSQYSLRKGKYPEITAIFPPDEWEKWNRGRDDLYASNPSARYLPEELSSYGPSLDPYGGWVFVPAYGYCWRPRVAVSAGWAPYKNGRWCWMGGNYVWISYDPWGYVPHHYGRWHVAATIGWVWVPPAARAVHWGPGYVGWAVSGAHVAWVPLGPRDVYHGEHYGSRGGYAGGTWTSGNVQINRTLYQNITVRNAVTVVHNETFIRGRHVDVKLAENPFLHQKVVARPEFRPERATKMPAIRNVADHEKPPALVRDLPRKAREEENFHAGLKGNPAGENRNHREQGSPEPKQLDVRAGKVQNPQQTASPMKREERQNLSGEPLKKSVAPGSQDRKFLALTARRNPEEVKGPKEAPRHFTNEDLKRFEPARTDGDYGTGRSREHVANPAPSGEKSLKLEPAIQKRGSLATPPERKQPQSFDSKPAREAQRLNSVKDERLQRIDQGRDRPDREQARPAEARQAQKEFRKTDRPIRETSREIPREVRQPVRVGRPVDAKPQPPAGTQAGGDGHAALRSLPGKAADAVKAATPSHKAPSAEGQQGGGFTGHAGKTGGFGMR